MQEDANQEDEKFLPEPNIASQKVCLREEAVNKKRNYKALMIWNDSIWNKYREIKAHEYIQGQ